MTRILLNWIIHSGLKPIATDEWHTFSNFLCPQNYDFNTATCPQLNFDRPCARAGFMGGACSCPDFVICVIGRVPAGRPHVTQLIRWPRTDTQLSGWAPCQEVEAPGEGRVPRMGSIIFSISSWNGIWFYLFVFVFSLSRQVSILEVTWCRRKNPRASTMTQMETGVPTHERLN